jgi:hypothetical protein
VGLLLGDLNAQKPSINSNARLKFEQSKIHEEYLVHLYNLLQTFYPGAPKIVCRTLWGKVHSSMVFLTYSLPCFNDFYLLFYPLNNKIVPLNIDDILTPLSLAYWICDDGCFCKRDRAVILCTDGFTLESPSSKLNF